MVVSETKRAISPDDVIKSLGYCSVEGGKCEKCAFIGGFGCIDRLMLVAAELLRHFCKPGLWETYEDEMCETVYIEEQPRWIPVTERLPEVVETTRVHRNVYRKSDRVLCTCLQADGKRLVRVGYMFFFNDNPQPKWAIPGTIHSVTHWQPLPEPPTPEECSAVGKEDGYEK